MDKLFAALCLAMTAPALATPADAPREEALEATIAALDGAVFDAFNHCGDPAQLR